MVTLDATLIMAADTISGYILGLLAGVEFHQVSYLPQHVCRFVPGLKFHDPAATAILEKAQRPVLYVIGQRISVKSLAPGAHLRDVARLFQHRIALIGIAAFYCVAG